MAFCTNCGHQLAEGANFCFECGAKVNKITSACPEEERRSRSQEYVGVILKCSNCGGAVGETDAICPSCGMKITRRSAVSSVTLFMEQLMAIEATRKKPMLGMFSIYAPADPADKKKLSLIRNFPIPNTVDDILEFVMLAIANIDVKISKKSIANSSQGMEIMAAEMPRAISNAWVAKLQQAYQKAEVLFPHDPVFLNIQKIYSAKMVELRMKR